MQLDYNISGNVLNLRLSGDYIGCAEEAAKDKLLAALHNSPLKEIQIDGKALGQWDSLLLSVLFELETKANQLSIPIKLNNIPEGLERLLGLAFAVKPKVPEKQGKKKDLVERTGDWGIDVYRSVKKGLGFVGEVFGSVGKSLGSIRKTDLLFALEDCGYKAVGIVTLISFMVGLILAFVGALQLKTFGAEIYVSSLVAIGMTRIMGAIMTGIIMAGRTGASYAATIGTMQVNEEIDALRTMGISPVAFLVLPRFLALTLTLPILTMWANFMGMLGGGFVGVFILDIPLSKYWEMSLHAIALNNFLVGVFHGLVFGMVIAICGCYYGINCGRDAESVGVATTKAVVSSIVWMVVLTGIITIIFAELKI